MARTITIEGYAVELVRDLDSASGFGGAYGDRMEWLVVDIQPEIEDDEHRMRIERWAIDEATYDRGDE